MSRREEESALRRYRGCPRVHGVARRGPIAGFIVAKEAADSGHIITIDVLAARRGAGVGSLLLDTAEERLRTAECRAIQLETAVDNISALAFYKRHGYHVIETFPRYYANGVDALVLKKELEKTRENPVGSKSRWHCES